MHVEVIQANYDELESMATRFGQLAESNVEMGSRLRQGAEKLRHGDWVGKGSEAFFNEMGDEVLPAVDRLIHALQQSQSTLNEIIFIVQQAEEEAARPFKGTASGPFQAPALGGVVQQVAEETAGPFAGGASVLFQSPAAGSAGPAGSVKQATPTTRDKLQAAYNIKIEKGDKEWSDQEIKHLERALSSLSTEEKKALRGYRFIRWSSAAERMKLDPTFKEGIAGEGGRQEMDLKNNSFKISMYDNGFADPEATKDEEFGVDKGQFTILHEVGHAMATAEIRDKFEANQPWADVQGRAETELDKLMKGAKKPTEYAGTNQHEQFAEMFAIYKANPKYLKDNYPKVFEWFQKEKFLKK